MKHITDDEILARAMRTPMSKRVPLKKGDRIIAMCGFTCGFGFIKKGSRGTVRAIENTNVPYFIKWDFMDAPWWTCHYNAIGKLVPREGR